MKKNEEGKKSLSLSARILAGALALILFAGTVFGVVAYFI